MTRRQVKDDEGEMRKVRAGVEEIRRHLRNYVEDVGYSEEFIVANSGVSRKTVSGVLRPGGINFRVDVLSKILRAIGVSDREFYATVYGLRAGSLEARFSLLLDILVQEGVIGRDKLRGLKRSSTVGRSGAKP